MNLKVQREQFLKSLCLFFAMGAGGCTPLRVGKPPGPWYDCYLPIEDEQVDQFIAVALKKAIAEYGDPVVPVKKVLVRRSKVAEHARAYAVGEGFTVTSCEDASLGIFVIYMNFPVEDEGFYPMLGHECFHLLNPAVRDWYMEGAATLFSEDICADHGILWGKWMTRLMRRRNEPYAISYRMMRQLRMALPDAYYRLPSFTTASFIDASLMRVDIDRWLSTLSGDEQKVALSIFQPDVARLKKHVSKEYSFTVPALLKK